MQQTREQFLARRRAGLGGSDMAKVLGVSEYGTAMDVWLSKMGRDVPIRNPLPLKVGQALESFVCQEYSERTGQGVVRHNAQLSSERWPYLIGNVDRLVIPAGRKAAAVRGRIITDRGLDAKTASAYARDAWGEDGTDQVPTDYIIQMQTYMMLTGCQFWDVAALIGNNDFRIYTITPDTELQDMIGAAAVEFWERYVLTQTPPPATCERDVALLYPSSTEGKRLAVTEADLALLEAYRRQVQLLAQVEADTELVEVAIKERMGDAEVLVDGDNVLATWKNQAARTTVDGKLLKRHHPDIYEQFAKTGNPFRKFAVR